MESVKDILNFCNSAVFYDYTNIRITVKLNQVRKGIINYFYKTIPHSRILVSLSRKDDVVLKINENDIDKTIGNIHDLRKIYFTCSHLRNWLETNNRLIDLYWILMMNTSVKYTSEYVYKNFKLDKTRKILESTLQEYEQNMV